MTANDENQDILQAITHDNPSGEIGDLYQLTQLVAGDREDLLESMIHALREDADCLEKAQWKIEEGEWSVEDAAVYIAQTAQFAEYQVDMSVTENPNRLE